jgi:hypothetical protein
MRVYYHAANPDLILRSPPKAGVSKDGHRNAPHRFLPYAIALPLAGSGEASLPSD